MGASEESLSIWRSFLTYLNVSTQVVLNFASAQVRQPLRAVETTTSSSAEKRHNRGSTAARSIT